MKYKFCIRCIYYNKNCIKPKNKICYYDIKNKKNEEKNNFLNNNIEERLKSIIGD